MSRAPLHSAALSSAALGRFTWVFLFLATVVADAETATHRYLRHQEKLPRRPSSSCACASLVQSNDGQAPAATAPAAPAATQCPCLVTPAPLMTPEETQAAAVDAAANTATLEAVKTIHEAAEEAADPIKKEIDALDVEKEVGGEVKKGFAETEKEYKQELDAEIGEMVAEEKNELEALSQTAKNIGALGAAHLRQTTEDWAANQAKNYVVQHAGPAVQGAVATSKQTEQIRQEAVELANTAIKASQQSVQVAQQAQAAIAMVPKDSFKVAQKNAKEAAKEQEALRKEIAISEDSLRSIAEVAQESAIMARNTLHEAQLAKETAKKALATSRSNAEKIELLKTRAQAAYEKSKKAKEIMDAIA